MEKGNPARRIHFFQPDKTHNIIYHIRDEKQNPTGRSMQIMLAYMESPIATICGKILTRHSEKLSPVRKEYQELANLYKVGVRFAP